MNLAAGVSLICASLLAADFNGVWVGQIPGRNDMFIDVAFKFVQNGTKLSGKVYGDYRSTPISEAIVAGDLITFVVITQEQAGNQINETRVRFTGKMIDGEIELTREREAATNAGNSGSAHLRNNSKQTFRLKRLF
jgi:hypothetical protein